MNIQGQQVRGAWRGRRHLSPAPGAFIAALHGATPLFKNSLYLMLSTLVLAVFGIFFWALVTRAFTTEQVGLASTLVAVMTFVNSFSLLGLNAGLIRYLPKSGHRERQISSSVVMVALVSVGFSLLFLLFVDRFAPRLAFVTHSLLFAAAFVLFVALSSLNAVVEGVFIALRGAEWVFVKNLTISLLKLGLPLALLSLGAYGIFSAVGGAIAVAVILSCLVMRLRFGVRLSLTVNLGLIKQMALFSLGNYIVTALGMVPLIVLPLLITDTVGPRTTAYYYMAMTIATMIYIIPQATTQSLLAEGAHDESRMRELIGKSARLIAAVLAPTVVIAVTCGNHALLFFGKEYAREGFALLQLLALSSVFVSINYVLWTILNIRYRIKTLILINTSGTAAIIGLSYLLIPHGLVGVGLAWLGGQALMSLLYASGTRKWL